MTTPAGRSLWELRLIFGGSLLPSILWGVAFANFRQGRSDRFWFELRWWFLGIYLILCLVGGLVTLSGFLSARIGFLILKTSGEMSENAVVPLCDFGFHTWSSWSPLQCPVFATDILSNLGGKIRDNSDWRSAGIAGHRWFIREAHGWALS